MTAHLCGTVGGGAMEAVGLLEAIRTASSAHTPPRGIGQLSVLTCPTTCREFTARGGNSFVG